MSLLNNCGFKPNSSPGTADTIEVGSAINNAYATPSEAGAVDGRTYTWRADEGTDYEIFTAQYNDLATDTLTGRTVAESKISGTHGTTKMNLTTSAEIRQVLGKTEFSRVNSLAALAFLGT